MKRYIFFAILFTIVFSSFGQQRLRDSVRNSYRQEFLLNPFSFFVGGFEVGYGNISAKQHNRRIFAGYYYSENPGFYNDGDGSSSTINNTNVTYKNMEGFRLEGQYLFMKPTDGDIRLYFGPYAIFKTISMDVSKVDRSSSTVTQTLNYKARGTSGSIGVMLGLRTYIMDNFFVDYYIGGGITIPFSGYNIDDVHLDVLNPYKRSVNPRLGATIGYAF